MVRDELRVLPVLPQPVGVQPFHGGGDGAMDVRASIPELRLVRDFSGERMAKRVRAVRTVRELLR